MSSLPTQTQIARYCQICQKGPFTRAQNALAHFSSAQHKEAEISSNNAASLSSFSQQFYCKLCSEQCNGPKTYMEHMASPRHKAREEKSRQFQTSEDEINRSNRPYDFDGKKGYCYLCSVNMTSQEDALKHLNGEKHRKMIKNTEQQTNMNCNACQIVFQSEASAKEHFAHVHQTSTAGNQENPFEKESLHSSHNSYLGKKEEQHPQVEDIDKLFQNFQLELQNEAPPQSVLDNTKKPKINPDQDYTFKISTGYCNVCEIDLTSIQHRDQHISGAKHKKAKQAWLARKAENVNVEKNPSQTGPEFDGSSLLEEVEYEFNGETGFCNVCRQELRSVEHASDHLSSISHKKAKEVWAQADVSLSIKHIDESRIQQNIKPEISVFAPQISSQPITSSASKPPTNKPDHYFDGKRGYCNICNLELTSKAHADQHLSGSKHQKAKQSCTVSVPSQRPPIPGQLEKEYTFDGKRGFCQICNVELTSKQHADQHLSGAKHLKAKASLETKPKPGLEQIKEVTSSRNEKKEYTFNGSRGYCNVCQIELTSKAHAESHLIGKPHNKAKQRWLHGFTENTALFCEICQIQCSGPESMQQHLASKRHKDRLTISEGDTYADPHTTWYTCEVCKCKLNSQQQLDIHKRSPKHLAQEEKFNNQGRSHVAVQAPTCHRTSYNTPGYGEVRQTNVKIAHQANPNNNYTNETTPIGYNNWNSQMKGNQFNQQQYSQLPPSFDKNTIPSYVKPVSKLPAAMVKGANYQVNLEFERNPENVGSVAKDYDFSPLSTFNPSLGTTLTLGSLRDDMSFRIDKERSMIKMARPSDSILTEGGVNSYRNLAHHETSVKGIPDIGLTSMSPGSVDCNITAMASDKEEISKSLPFKSEIDEIASKLRYDHRGYPDGGNPEAETKDNLESSKSLKKSNKTEHEMIVPEITTDVLPYTGDMFFSIEEITKSSSDSSSNSRRTTSTDTARAIKNRSCSKQSSVTSLTDTSLESSADDKETSQSENNRNMLCEDTSDKDSLSGMESLDKINEENVKSPGTSLEMKSTTVVNNTGRNPDRSSPYLYYCHTCKAPMNTKKSYEAHITGQRHLGKVAVEEAPDREHPPLQSGDNFCRIGLDLTKTKPRSYQVELYNKTMESDRVCFLPTGTGKTLISCMTISAMLLQNPTRQIMFLVDKVLLVLQQSKYIKSEIGDRTYTRFNHDDPSKLEERQPLIATLCGGSQSTGGIPLWKHDIIVVTAAFYENLLMKKVLRWSDNCLVVFDEAHHCIKNHPFNKLLQGYHRKCESNTRPKMLGLTASPAGRETVSETVAMLNQLTDNLGGATIALVEENIKELKKYQSSASMEIHFTQMTSKERSFKEELQVYLLNCYTRLCEETDLLQQFDLGLKSKKGLSDKEFLECAKEVDGSLLNSLEITINMAHPKQNSRANDKIFARNLIKHSQYVCIALNVLIESGVDMAVEELQELMAQDPSTNFAFAEENGLPCEKIKYALEICMNMEGSNIPLGSHEGDTSPQLAKLVEIVTRPDHVNWSDKEAMVLVLVKQRETAFKMKNMLTSHDSIRKLRLNVEAVVGHGTTSGTEQGMTVARQKQISEDMKRKVYDIVVATSVAEEGIDIPECELVVTFNPPSTVTALVQMRGRARKNNSKFIILCNNSKEKGELENLMLKEKNMIDAAKIIIEKGKKR